MRREGPPDKRLFRRARHGDREAFGALLRRYDPRLRRLTLRLVAEPTRVDPVLSRAYLRAWRSLPHVEPPESVAEWLYRLVYNACINEVRWAPAKPMPDMPSGPWIPLPLATPARRIAGLRALSPEDRVPLVLVDGEGFSIPAAARILRRPQTDVAADVARARQLWRRLVVGDPTPTPKPDTATPAKLVPASPDAEMTPPPTPKPDDPDLDLPDADTDVTPTLPVDTDSDIPGTAAAETPSALADEPSVSDAAPESASSTSAAGTVAPGEATAGIETAEEPPGSGASDVVGTTTSPSASAAGPDAAPESGVGAPAGPEPATTDTTSVPALSGAGAADTAGARQPSAGPASAVLGLDVTDTATAEESSGSGASGAVGTTSPSSTVTGSDAAGRSADDASAGVSVLPSPDDVVAEPTGSLSAGMVVAGGLSATATVADVGADAAPSDDGSDTSATSSVEAAAGTASVRAEPAQTSDDSAARAEESSGSGAFGVSGADGGRKWSLGRRLKRSFGAPEPLVQVDESTPAEGVVLIATEKPDEKASSGSTNGSKTEVFVVSAPVASETETESESEGEADDGSTAEDQSAARRSGTAGTRRKRRPDVTRNPRTRGRSVQGDGGSTKSDHASDGPSRTDSPRETS